MTSRLFGTSLLVTCYLTTLATVFKDRLTEKFLGHFIRQERCGDVSIMIILLDEFYK